MYGRDYNYAASRLVDTVVMLGDVPVYIMGINADCTVNYSDLGGTRGGVCNLDDLNLTPVKLGFVNHKGSAYYIVRKPMRRDWRQGMRLCNVTCTNKPIPRDMSLVDIQNTIVNNFPTLDEVKGQFKSGANWGSLAWCRLFALNRRGQLLHASDVVGYYNKETDKFVLKEEYQYLNEALMECL